MEPDSVEVLLHAAGRCEDGYGGWAAVLAYGSHRRTLSGSDSGTTSHRMALTAVSEGLAALNRPCRVRICADDSTLHKKRAQRLPPDEPELWRRLRPLLGRHHVEWDESGGDPDDPLCDLAAEVAYHHHRGEAVRAEAQGGQDTLAGALSQFLAERWEDMRAFEDADAVISALRFSIFWYGDKPVTEMAPAEITDELWAFFDRALPHKQHASAEELLAAQHVTTGLLSWLASRGALDADEARNHSDSISRTVEQRVRLKAFVDAFARDEPPSPPLPSAIEDRVDCLYLRITEKTGTSLTFLNVEEGPDDKGDLPTVGPIAVRPDVAAMAEIGWSILLSAVKAGGTWQLLEVISGDP